MMRNKKKTFSMCIMICTWLSSMLVLSMPMGLTSNDKIKTNEVLEDSVTVVETINPKDSIKNELIKEVENYVFGNFPKTNKSIPTSIVENGLEHGVDIMFIMAQTQIETHFGTAGAGRETSRRSLFGVANRRYNTYDEAIVHYLTLLKSKYLTKGRTEHHLMQRYTTSGGARYAENPNYEVELRGTYSDISRKTNIKVLQDKYRNYEEI